MWFLLAFLSVVCAVAPPCPPDKDVYPCYCYEDGFLTSVNCEGFRNLESVSPVLENTRGQNLSFGFWKSYMGDIPSEFFTGHQSVSLHFEKCKIGSFGSRPFSGLENSLKRIYIYGSVDKRRKDLETFALGHLRQLESLAFQANDIKRLGNDWFEGGPSSLIDLNLEANDIEELGDRAFADLENVEQIWLGDNRVPAVYRSMFPKPAKNLWLLEISFNGLTDLPQDLFDDMPALKRVNFSGNRLKTLPEATWGRIWGQFEEVYFQRNQGFICDENIRWIFERPLPKLIFGDCQGDNKLSGKKLQDLRLEDFK